MKLEYPKLAVKIRFFFLEVFSFMLQISSHLLPVGEMLQTGKEYVV